MLNVKGLVPIPRCQSLRSWIASCTFKVNLSNLIETPLCTTIAF